MEKPEPLLKRVEFKIFIPFRLHLKNVAHFPLIEDDFNLFLDRNLDNSKLTEFQVVCDHLNAEFDTREVAGAPALWRLVNFEDITPDTFKEPNPVLRDASYCAVSIRNNKRRFFKGTFEREHHHAIAQWELNQLFEELAHLQPDAAHLKSKMSGCLSAVDFWFYDWNVGGIDLTIDIKVAFEEISKSDFNAFLAQCFNKTIDGYFKSPRKASKKEIDQCLSQAERQKAKLENRKDACFDLETPARVYYSKTKDILVQQAAAEGTGHSGAGEANGAGFCMWKVVNTIGREIVRRCELEPAKRSQTFPRCFIKLLFGNFSALVWHVNTNESGLDEQGPLMNWLREKEHLTREKEEYFGWPSKQFAYLSGNSDTSLVLGNYHPGRLATRRSKVLWLWRIVLVYWSALEWLNVLFAKQLDEVGQIFIHENPKAGMNGKGELGWRVKNRIRKFRRWWKRFWLPILDRTKEYQSLPALLADSHKTRNRLLLVMREFSVTNLHDNTFEREILLSLKKHFYLEPLEDGIKELMEILIDEQRKFKSDLTGHRGKAIQNLIILNIIFGVTVILFDHVFLDRKYRFQSSEEKPDPVYISTLEQLQDSIEKLEGRFETLLDSLERASLPSEELLPPEQDLSPLE